VIRDICKAAFPVDSGTPLKFGGVWDGFVLCASEFGVSPVV
jgi:hypothetical protein